MICDSFSCCIDYACYIYFYYARRLYVAAAMEYCGCLYSVSYSTIEIIVKTSLDILWRIVDSAALWTVARTEIQKSSSEI